MGQTRSRKPDRPLRRLHEVKPCLENGLVLLLTSNPRLAFDTIGICAFNYRFNDFYLDRPHQFASQMAEVLIESGKRAGRPQIENYVRIWSNAHNQENVAMMHKLCDDLVAERKRNPKPEVNDLLNVMLNAKDPQTGEGLSDENIRYQMVTFLVCNGPLICKRLLIKPRLLATRQQVERYHTSFITC